MRHEASKRTKRNGKNNENDKQAEKRKGGRGILYRKKKNRRMSEESIGMGMVIVIVQVEGGRRIIRVVVVGVIIGVIGIGLGEAEEGPEAESETTQLLQRETAHQIQQLLTRHAIFISNARHRLPYRRRYACHRYHYQAVENHSDRSIDRFWIWLCFFFLRKNKIKTNSFRHSL